MQVPQQLRYSRDHEWVSVEGTRAKVGITDYAQDALGDVVYVQVPTAGAAVKAGDSFGEVESTKSVSDVYAPVSGTVVAINATLADNPELLNSDPYGAGWLCEIECSDLVEIQSLLDAMAYQALIEG
ncbi:MAG: glycine cleavage system protein GcvH [Actinomycetota bacterium]